MEQVQTNYLKNKLQRQTLFDEIAKTDDTVKQNQQQVRELTTSISILERKVKEEPTKPSKPHISFDEDLWGVAIVSLGIVFLILFLLHWALLLLGWLFNCDWGIWSWISFIFKWSLIIGGAVVALKIIIYFISKPIYNADLQLYKMALEKFRQSQEELKIKTQQLHKTQSLINKLQNENKGNILTLELSLASDIRDLFGIPILDSAIQINVNYESCEEVLSRIDALIQQAASETDMSTVMKIRKQIVDMKLLFFYTYSIKAECGQNTVLYTLYQEQQDQAKMSNNYNILRLNESEFLSSEDLTVFSLDVPQTIRLLKENKMDDIIQKFNHIQARDTSGIVFTDLDALSQKTADMNKFYNAARYEYTELDRLNKRINRALDFSRICAYRNIYLGIELINYIRTNAGGKTLTTEKTNVSVNSNEIVNISTLNLKLNMDILSNLGNTGKEIWNALENKDIRSFVSKNPKLAAGAAILSAVVNIVEERATAIENNNNAQTTMIKNIKKIYDGYVEGQVNLLREIEIIKAIFKANEGFMSIYMPIRKKVFDENDFSGITMQNIQQLAIAIGEYKKISTSKL